MIDPADTYHIWRWRLISLWVIVFTCVTFYSVQQNRSLSQQTHAALCTFKHELEGRIVASKRFLSEHPNGLPGIATPQEIQQDIKNRQAAVDSLEILHCS